MGVFRVGFSPGYNRRAAFFERLPGAFLGLGMTAVLLLKRSPEVAVFSLVGKTSGNVIIGAIEAFSEVGVMAAAGWSALVAGRIISVLNGRRPV